MQLSRSETLPTMKWCDAPEISARSVSIKTVESFKFAYKTTAAVAIATAAVDLSNLEPSGYVYSLV
jgi:hypothetical protein